jgi:hypothetical protein
MALGTFIAGRYSSTHNAVDLGICQEGYALQLEPKEAVINRSDAFGDMMIDTIYRGADWFLQLESLEYKAGPIGSMYPFGALGTLGIVGRLGSDLATALVLTATAGTPAATAPASLTGSKAKLAANSGVSLQFSSVLRTVPIRMSLYPFDAGSGVIKHFTTT